MKVYTDVRSAVEPQSMVVLATKVIINTDIHQIEVEQEGATIIEYSFTQTEYDKDEYIKLMAEQNASLEFQLTDAQLALCDIYEALEG